MKAIFIILTVYFYIAFLVGVFQMGMKFGVLLKNNNTMSLSFFYMFQFVSRVILFFPSVISVIFQSHFRLFDFFRIKKEISSFSVSKLLELKKAIKTDRRLQIEGNKNYLTAFILTFAHLRMINRELKKRGETIALETKDERNIDITW